MDNDLGRLKTLCRGLYYILTLLTAGLIVLVALMLLVFVVEAADPGAVTDGEDPVSMSMVAAATLMLVIATIVVIMLRNIAKSIYKEYSPFTHTNVRRFEFISLACLLTIALVPLVHMDTPLTATDVAGFVIGAVLAAATFYILALVFRYGSWLQKESDETL